MAIATVEILSSNSAIVDVTYADGSFGIEKVDIRRGFDIYEAAYQVACVKAAVHGEQIERFKSHV